MRKFTIWLTCLLLFVGMGIANAQTKVITGNVTGADDGLPIPGVTVMVPGTTVGTTTDFDGNYTLSVPGDATVLSFSFIGMVAQEVEIGGRSVINVVLQTSSTALEEVVVTALGISREKKALGYSVTEVGADDIESTPATDVVNALAGKVAGVRINNSSGAAGGSTFVEIRGSASITQNNQPLYVIDGIPIQSGGGSGGVAGVATSNRTIDINPDDVESMSVLKGAAATALYGLRAGNGVIMITTKQGKAKKGLNINFSSSVRLDQISQVPALNTKYAQGSNEYAAYLGGFGLPMQPGGYADPDQRWYNGVSWGPKMDTLRYTTDASYVPGDLYWNGGTTSMEDYIKYWDPNGRIVGMSSPYAGTKAVTPYDRYEYFQTGYTYTNSLNVSGGNDISTYYLSFSNLQQEGTIPNNTLDRNTFKMTGSTKPAENLKVTSSVTYTNTKGQRIQQGSNISGVMLGLLRTPPTFDNSYGYKFTDSEYRFNQQRTYRNGGGYDNPYWISNEIAYLDDVNRMLGNINVEWDINDWVKLSYRGGIDFISNHARNNWAPYSNNQKPGFSSTFNSTTIDQNHDLYLNITRDLTEDLKLTALLGYNMYETDYQSTTASANDINIIDFYDVSNTTDIKGFENEFGYRTKAFYADINLAYKSMLYFGFTGRYEWSTTLPEANNAFFYPAATLGFVFTELPAFKDMEWLTFGKLRASYADIANVPSPYNTRTFSYKSGAGDGWTSGVQFPFNGYNGFSLGNVLGNPDLKPESSKEWELGLTMNMFNNRVSLDLAYFSRKNEDLLLNVPVASSSGYGFRYMNAASMETDGFEVLINATLVKTKDFTWDLTLNWSNPNTVVTELAPGVPNVFLGGFTEPQVRAVAGSQYRSIYGFAWLRDDQGRLLINSSGYPQQDPETQLLGGVQADWNAGITNTFTYKGFTLSALIDIKQGGQMWNGTKGALYYFGAHADTENRDEDYTFEGVYGGLDNNGDVEYTDASGNVVTTPVTNTEVVKLDEDWRFWSGLGSGFTGPSEDYIEDAGWVRLREVTLSYNFSSLVSDVKWIKNLEVYFTGYNLWLSTDYTGIDPETSLLGSSNAQGFDYFNMPGTKSYTFGLKVGF